MRKMSLWRLGRGGRVRLAPARCQWWLEGVCCSLIIGMDGWVEHVLLALYHLCISTGSSSSYRQ